MTQRDNALKNTQRDWEPDMPKALYALFAACTVLLLSAPAAATDDRMLTVGVEEISYLPHYAWDGNEYGGFARLLFDAFAQDADYRLTYKAFPVKRLNMLFFNTPTKIDLKYPDNPYWTTALRENKNVIYSGPVAAFVDGVLVLPHNKGKLDPLESLGSLRGFTPVKYLEAIEEGTLTVSENSKLQNLLLMTIKGRVQGAYVNVSVARNALAAMGQEKKLVFDPSLPHVRSQYHLSTISHPYVIWKFNRWMQDNADRIKTMKQTWGIEVD